jgi:hypothetical protein
MTTDESADILNEQWHRYVAARNEALATRSLRAVLLLPDTESSVPNESGLETP